MLCSALCIFFFLKAERPDQPLRLYIVTYDNSIEQYKYRSEIQREIDVFTDLIQNKGKIIIPIDMAGGAPSSASQREVNEPCMGVARGSVISMNAITRRAGGRKTGKPVPMSIVVDMREFMSSLPAVLHHKGFKIAPVTLEVGGGRDHRITGLIMNHGLKNASYEEYFNAFFLGGGLTTRITGALFSQKRMRGAEATPKA